MKQLQFDSHDKNFHALEIPEHVMGCTGIFWLYNQRVNNTKIGKIYGESGGIMFDYTGETLSDKELWELSNFAKSIKKHYETLNVS